MGVLVVGFEGGGGEAGFARDEGDDCDRHWEGMGLGLGCVLVVEEGSWGGRRALYGKAVWGSRLVIETSGYQVLDVSSPQQCLATEAVPPSYRPFSRAIRETEEHGRGKVHNPLGHAHLSHHGALLKALERPESNSSSCCLRISLILRHQKSLRLERQTTLTLKQRLSPGYSSHQNVESGRTNGFS